MPYMTPGRAAASGVVLVLVSALVALVPTAEARHINGKKLCSRKYDKPFKHWGTDPIRARRGGNGRLSYNYRLNWIGRKIRLCVVTIRKGHKRPRFTGVRIKSVDAGKWRRDASHDYRFYAGPVVRALWSHGINPAPASRKRLRGRGTIGKAFCKFSLRYLHDADDLPVILRMRSRCTAPDGHDYFRKTRWLTL